MQNDSEITYLEGRMSNNTKFFEIYTKFGHMFIPMMILCDFFWLRSECRRNRRRNREFRRDIPNLTSEMKSARKITPYTYYSCIGDLSTYVNIYRVFFKHESVWRFAGPL